MTTAQSGIPIEVVTADPRGIDTDLVVFPVFERELSRDHVWAGASGGEVERAVASGEFKGKLYELFVTPKQLPSPSGG